MSEKHIMSVFFFLFVSTLSAQMMWTQTTTSAAWTARYDHASVAFDNKIWIIGGNDGVNRNNVWYSTDGVIWTQATANATWSARQSHSSVIFDNKIWVMGGYDGSNRNDVWYSTGLGIEDNREPVSVDNYQLSAFPNPLKTKTIIRYSLPVAQKVRLSIYNTSGVLIKSLVDTNRPAGEYSVVWNGRDENNQVVANGIYFYTLLTSSYKSVNKLILNR